MIERIASAGGHNDDVPNIALAEEIAAGKDISGLAEISAGVLSSDSRIAGDCIKIMYETAYRAPEMVSGYSQLLTGLLSSKNNRLVWGAMIALSCIAPIVPSEIFGKIDTIIRTYEKGSVITRDCAVSVFAELAKADPEYEKRLFPLLIEHLRFCRPKEVAQHAERAFVCINQNNAGQYRKVLETRSPNLTDAQKKRVDKLLKRIEEKNFIS